MPQDGGALESMDMLVNDTKVLKRIGERAALLSASESDDGGCLGSIP